MSRPTDDDVTTFAIATFDLHRVLKSAALFASSDATVPAINTIRLERIGGHLLAIATDRFKLGVLKAPVSNPTGEFEVTLSLSDAKRIIAATKLSVADQRRSAWGEHVTFVNLGTEASGSRAVVVNVEGSTVRALDIHSEATFPKWRQLLALSGERDCDQRTAYTPQNLAAFSTAAWGKHDAVMFEPGSKPNRPTTIRIGDYFTGLIMPYRREVGEDDALKSTWTELLAETGMAVAA